VDVLQDAPRDGDDRRGAEVDDQGLEAAEEEGRGSALSSSTGRKNDEVRVIGMAE
jgi:hypothetical protein